MPEIVIRPAPDADWPDLFKIDTHYQTNYVWQMERSISDGSTAVHFREVRLPRSIKVEYPHSPHQLAEVWARGKGMVIKAGLEQDTVGYIRVDDQLSPRTAWITDLAVRPDARRQGIASGLVLAAQDWAAQRGYRRITLEMQSKNYPAIQLALRLGFEFSGYQDQYFSNQDTALFFNRMLR